MPIISSLVYFLGPGFNFPDSCCPTEGKFVNAFCESSRETKQLAWTFLLVFSPPFFLNTIFFPSTFQTARKDLLQLDFEGILKYFRINMPKYYMLEPHRKDLVKTIYDIKVFLKLK